jgi:hypothetical protein
MDLLNNILKYNLELSLLLSNNKTHYVSFILQTYLHPLYAQVYFTQKKLRKNVSREKVYADLIHKINISFPLQRDYNSFEVSKNSKLKYFRFYSLCGNQGPIANGLFINGMIIFSITVFSSDTVIILDSDYIEIKGNYKENSRFIWTDTKRRKLTLPPKYSKKFFIF